MENPVGANGFLTKIGERVPGINNGIQALHKRAGKTEALERARRNDPIGAQGTLTKIGEHIPGVNQGIQELHKRAGKAEALERARRNDPIGAHGAITMIGEFIPGVNNGIQELHKRAGQGEALKRAEQHNPLGADGILTTVGERIPVLNDGILALHSLAGKKDQADRVRARTVQGMLSKDGAITKVAEMMPGLNLVAAALHEHAGNYEEAERARHLLDHWGHLGDADGALATLAEMLPGVDVVAFGVHLAAGSYAQALRSIIKCPHCKWEVTLIQVDVISARMGDLCLADLDVNGVQIKPKAPSTVGGLIDVAMHYMRVDKTGKPMQGNLQTRVVTAANGALRKSIREGLEKGLGLAPLEVEKAETKLIYFRRIEIPDRVRKFAEPWRRRLQDSKEVRERFPTALPQFDAAVEWLTFQIQQLLPSTLPPPSKELLAAVQDCVLSSACVHGPRPLVPLVYESDSSRRDKLRDVSAAASCMSFLACFACGLHTGGVGCLAGSLAGLVHFRNWTSKRVIERLNHQNLEACAAHASRSGGGAAADADAASAAGEEGVSLQLESDDVKRVVAAVREYVFEEVLSDHVLCTRVVKAAIPLLRNFLACSVTTPSVPLAVEIDVPEQLACSKAKGQPLDITLPNFKALLLLEFNLVRNPLVKSAKLLISDADVSKIVHSLRDQVVKQDLRSIDHSLSDFTEPVLADFKLGMAWKEPTKLKLECKDVSVKLYFPH